MIVIGVDIGIKNSTWGFNERVRGFTQPSIKPSLVYGRLILKVEDRYIGQKIRVIEKSEFTTF